MVCLLADAALDCVKTFEGSKSMNLQQEKVDSWWRAAAPDTFVTSLEAVSEPAETMKFDFERESAAWPKGAAGRLAAGGCLANRAVDHRLRFNGVAWLMQVHRISSAHTGLSHRALFLATSILDRFLFLTQRPVKRMQLLAAAALLVASKMEDEIPVSTKRLEKLAGGAFTQEELRQLELEILSTLDYDVEAVTVAEFLGNFVAAWRVANDLNIGTSLQKDSVEDLDLELLMRCAWAYAGKPSDEDRRRWNGTWHLASLSLLDTKLQDTFKPSEIAAASLLLSNRHLRLQEPWGMAITRVTGYSTADLEDCVDALESLRLSQMQATARQSEA